jgi:hypothetical protein
MPTVVLLASLAAVVILLFVAMGILQSHLGLKDFRFGSKCSYSGAKLEQYIKKDQQKARLVVVPLLFPLDFLLLIFLGLFLALCSMTYADVLHLQPGWRWLLLVLPVAYMVADFSENVLYSGMLLWPDSIGRLTVAGNWATRIKWLTAIPPMLLVPGAFVLAYLG